MREDASFGGACVDRESELMGEGWFRLDEALKRHEQYELQEWEAPIIAAASRECGRFVPCPTCKGKGVWGLRVDFERTDGRIFDGEDPNKPCPDCRGGVQLNPDMIERAAEADHDLDQSGRPPAHVTSWEDCPNKPKHRAKAEAVLWAALEGSDE